MAGAAAPAVSQFIQITPFMHVPDIDRAVAFFEEVLGFEAKFRQQDYAYVEREGAAIRMLRNHGDDGAPPIFPPSPRSSCAMPKARPSRSFTTMPSRAPRM